MNSTNLNGRTRSSLLTALVLAAAGASLALPAAADSIDLPQKTISYADLDLSRAEGAATLYGRLRQAAKQVCGNPGRRVQQIVAWRACYDQAISDAVARVDRPTLTAHHEDQTGTRPEPAMVSSRTIASVDNQE